MAARGPFARSLEEGDDHMTAGFDTRASQADAPLGEHGDHLPVLIRRSRRDKRCDYINAAWMSFTGRDASEELGTGWTDGIHAGDRERTLKLIEGALDAREPFSVEYRLRYRDGTYRWLLDQCAPYRQADGTLGGFFHCAVETTERKEANERLARTLDEQKVLLQELRHRINNHFQMVLSLLSMQGQEADSAEVRQELHETIARVRAIALIEQHLDPGDKPGRVRFGEHLRALAEALRPLFVQRSIELAIEVDDSDTGLELAPTAALLVNELMTNALKHAFPEGQSGKVSVVAAAAGDMLKVVVADEGIGLPGHINPERAASRGMRLIRRLAKQIDAGITVERNGGTCYILTIPR